MLTRTVVGRFATGRIRTAVSELPEVLGRLGPSTCGRGPSFFFFGLMALNEATFVDHSCMLSESAVDKCRECSSHADVRGIGGVSKGANSSEESDRT